MAYCVYSDVQLVINTALTSDQITSIIEMSDAEIDKRIGSQTAGDKLIKKLSMLLSAHTIKTRQPQSRTVGEYKETHNPLEVWEREIERIIRLYKSPVLKASPYQHIDEDERYTEEVA